MAVDDFWLRVYGFSDDLHPVSDAEWQQMRQSLVAEFHRFPPPTREALRAHVATLIARLTQLHALLG